MYVCEITNTREKCKHCTLKIRGRKTRTIVQQVRFFPYLQLSHVQSLAPHVVPLGLQGVIPEPRALLDVAPKQQQKVLHTGGYLHLNL